MKKAHSRSSFFWDLWCILSIVGIWPRFIEPRWISTTKLSLEIPQLPNELDGLKILQFSDLHFHPNVSDRFLRRLEKKILSLKPDIIVFTGDFLCYSLLDDSDRLANFLCRLKAPYGCYAILGNHDYERYVCVSPDGMYSIESPVKDPARRGLKRVFFGGPPLPSGEISPEIRNLSLHSELVSLLQSTPFKLLHNTTKVIPVRGSCLNICGLGEHMLDRTCPGEAYQNYDAEYPGLILTHNPDSLPKLKNYPGDIVLCGHTHGGQIHIFGFHRKFVLSENPKIYKGLHKIDNRWVYISRGVGSTFPFRWLCTPELVLITLKGTK